MAKTIVVTSEVENGPSPSVMEGIPHALRVVRQELRRLYRMGGNYDIRVTVSIDDVSPAISRKDDDAG